jgi:hypothetical protein
LTSGFEVGILKGIEKKMGRMRFFAERFGGAGMGKRVIACAAFLLLFLGGSVTADDMPPVLPFTFYGTASVNGTPLTQADTAYSVSLYVDGVELVSYSMGDYPAAGDSYKLEVPMDYEPAVTDKGYPGDTAYVYINGVEVDESPLTLGGYGITVPQDINATVYTISGYVRDSLGTGIEDVEMTGLPGDLLTASDGHYSGLVPPAWTGTVTPQKSGYTFSPEDMSYSSVSADHTDQNYTATLITYTISGFVLTSVGTGMSDVEMSGLPGAPVTLADGSYAGTVPYGWTGVVTPMKSGYEFSPPLTSYIDVTSDHTGQNYTGSLVGNLPPVALAGPDQNVEEGVLVTLDGSNSCDGDDGIYAYLWAKLDGPTVVLSSTAVQSPTFLSPSVDLDGEALSFTLTVKDYDGQESADTCIVNVLGQNIPQNVPPFADAGPNQEAEEGDLVVLDGDNSYDPEGTISSFLWIQLTGPSVTLSDETFVQPTFTAPGGAPEGESLVFELFVADDGGLQASDTCIVTVLRQNSPPVADAGTNQVVGEGETVLMDASGSHDPDGDDINMTYVWKQVQGTSVHLSNAAEMMTTFTAPAVGDDGESFVFELFVTDEWGLSSKDSCIVSVETPLNTSPEADAGADMKVNEGSGVNLDGTGSNDTDGAIAWSMWSQVSGKPVTLEDRASLSASFAAPEVGPDGAVLVFQITVCDGVLLDSAEVSVQVVDVEEDGGGPGGMCFVATAVFGSPLETEVEILRALRDRYLMKQPLGRVFVRLYYRYGPYAAGYIADRETLRQLVRTGLYPLIGTSFLLVNTTVFQKLIILILFCASFTVIAVLRKKKGKRGFRDLTRS